MGPVLQHPNLWHLNRRSVSGGVAVGAFAGLIPGPLQMIGGALLAVVFRVNLPVAVFTTFYTNPFTIVPLYIVAYEIGTLVTGQPNGIPQMPPPLENGEVLKWMAGLMNWMTSLGEPLLIGLPLLGVILAAASYVAVRGLWRLFIVVEWRKRCRNRSKT